MPYKSSYNLPKKVALDLAKDIELQKTSNQPKAKNTKHTHYSKLEIPSDLERVVTVIEPTDDMVKIGEEVTEPLAITAQQFYVKPKLRIRDYMR
jgi:hypothetical protein